MSFLRGLLSLYLLYCYSTLARIDPSVLPESTYGNPPSKMVDLAVVIKPSAPELLQSIRTYIQMSRASSINQTDYPPLRLNPIAISAETKVDGGNTTARIQMMTWALSQIKRLRNVAMVMRTGYEGPISLPLLLAQGHDWIFYLAVQLEEGGKVVSIYYEINLE